MSHRNSLLLLALTAALWSLGGLLIKSIPLHPLGIAGARSLISAVVLAIAARRFKFIWTLPQFGAAISFALTVLLFVVATKMTTAANAILLQYTAPVYVALLSAPLLSEKIRRADWLVLAIVLGGMVLFFIEDVSTDHLVGNILALLSGVTFAGIAICLRMQKGVSTFESLFLGHMLAGIVGLPFLFSGNTPTGHDWILIFTLGVVQLGIPYVLYGIAIRRVTALEATLIPVIEPILNPIWVALFFGERPSGVALCGGSIVIGAVLFHSYLTLKREPATFEILAPVD